MCFFDSPVGRCEVIKELVLLDETQRECAGEHGCPPDIGCPLRGYFAEVSGVSDASALPEFPRVGAKGMDASDPALQPHTPPAEALEPAMAR